MQFQSITLRKLFYKNRATSVTPSLSTGIKYC